MNKYKINEFIDKLSYKDYGKAIKCMARELGIAVNTLHNYRKIKIGDPQDIPYRIVMMMEQMFEIEEGNLKNYQVSKKPLRIIINSGRN